jgi:hypothetical protein
MSSFTDSKSLRNPSDGEPPSGSDVEKGKETSGNKRKGNPAWVKGMVPYRGGGRKKGLAATFRDVVDYDALAKMLFKLAMDPCTAGAVKVQAAKLCCDRGYGQAPATVRVEDAGKAVGAELAKYLSDEQLEALERAQELAREDIEAAADDRLEGGHPLSKVA